MTEQLRWREKRDRDGKVIPTCWETDTGYTLAECRLPEARYVVTRPNGRAPFAYTPDRDQVPALILADMQAQAAMVAEEVACA